MSDHNPTMFCHDGTSIYYPTAPGRVYIITIAALADCDGSDEDLGDSTTTSDLEDLLAAGFRCDGDLRRIPNTLAPTVWPQVHHEVGGVLDEEPDLEATAADFHDALEQWADWCDRDSERLDTLDGLAPAINSYRLVDAVSCSQPAVAI